MKIACIGGGPAGLYLGILVKRSAPEHDVVVYERNRPNDTFGFGVVFSDATLGHLAAADPETHAQITAKFARWDDIEIHIGGEVLRSTGHGFCGLERKTLLNILQARAKELGVHVEFEHEVKSLAEVTADVIVACDGVASPIRDSLAAELHPRVEMRPNKFVWLGCTVPYDAFTFLFKETPFGLFRVHAYRYQETGSTFIVECREDTWRAAGLANADEDRTVAILSDIFAAELGGSKLIKNRSIWRNFPTVRVDKWHTRNIVLLGDAVHTAHFSIGSGTKLAMEDAIVLRDELLAGHRDIPTALAAYEAKRRPEVESLQAAAQASLEWFEGTERYMKMAPVQFTYSLMTRSLRVSHASVAKRDPHLASGVERLLAASVGVTQDPPPPPTSLPVSLGDRKATSRIAVAPRPPERSPRDSIAGDDELVLLGAAASTNPGLVVTPPMSIVGPTSPRINTDDQAVAWRRVVDYVHQNTGAKFALQLAHAGRKGSTRKPWSEDANDKRDYSDQPLESGNWEIIAPSPLAWSETNATPREMTRADMDRVKADFVRATLMGEQAGFDMLELHCGHGYLLSSFLTPISNQRTDDYGGSIENRLRFPLEVFEAMRAAWPKRKPMSVRISATDWHDDGLSAEDSIAIAEAFAEAGADLIDVSAGQTTPLAKPLYGRMFQTPFCDRIRNEARVKTMAVGNIFEPDHINSILAAGRADLCALARPHLMDPNWSLRAAAELGYGKLAPPKQYRTGYAQMQRMLSRKDS